MCIWNILCIFVIVIHNLRPPSKVWYQGSLQRTLIFFILSIFVA